MRHLIRLGAALTSALIATTLLVGPADAAPNDQAADWLSGQLTDGLVHNDQFAFDDYGLTADVAFALKETGGQGAAVADIRDALADNVKAWTTFQGDIFAGSTAKALVLAQVTGANPKSFGGLDLVARLNKRVGKNGRIRDKAAQDFSNTIGQSFAARGLGNANSRKADEATAFLLQQQCSKGFFRLTFARPSKKNQSCDAGNATTSAPDTDVTALAVINLQATRQKTRAIRTAIDDAVQWLVRRQKKNGSFGGGPSTRASNANSTGLAAWALGEQGACGPARKAAQWVRDLQVPGGVGGTPLAGETGAVAYDRSAYQDGETDGIGDDERDQWRRATAQAGPGLLNLSLQECRGQ